MNTTRIVLFFQVVFAYINYVFLIIIKYRRKSIVVNRTDALALYFQFCATLTKSAGDWQRDTIKFRVHLRHPNIKEWVQTDLADFCTWFWSFIKKQALFRRGEYISFKVHEELVFHNLFLDFMQVEDRAFDSYFIENIAKQIVKNVERYYYLELPHLNVELYLKPLVAA